MSDKTIDSYLFNEMSDAEREKFEAEFIGDDELFYRIADRENELVDRYVNGELRGDELSRFEASLASNPARRQKIANSRVLREFISDERAEHKTITIAERSGFFAKVAGLFTFRSGALQLASIAAIVVLAAASIYLLIENRRLGSLEAQLAEATEREAALFAQLETSQGAAGELTVDLDNERKRIEELRAQIAELKGREKIAPGPDPRPPVTIATLILSGTTRGGPALVHRLELPQGAAQISMVIVVDKELKGDSLDVRLNGNLIRSRVRPVVRRTGETAISMVVPVSKTTEGRNEITVYDQTGAEIERYIFSISREN